MAIGTDSLPLIATKLHRAPIDRLHVHRPLLLERLEQRRSRPLTLVSAPAGYGKSILIRCWLESCNTPGSWLSLDENDNDLRMFAGYFVAAVKKLFPGACRKTEGLLTAPDLPPAAEMGAILINELNDIEQSFILALDDFHFIKNEAVLDMMRFLLSHPPRAMHLVLIGRHDPALPISSLRSKSLVTEIRTRDLRFDLRQTEDYLTQLLGNYGRPIHGHRLNQKNGRLGDRFAVGGAFHASPHQTGAQIARAACGCSVCDGIPFFRGLQPIPPGQQKISNKYQHLGALLRPVVRGGLQAGG